MVCFDDLGTDASVIIGPLVSQMVYLEGQLEALRHAPLLLVDRKDPTRQQQTPAAHLYTRLISRYADIVAKLMRLSRQEVSEEESPLRAYLKTLEMR